MSDRDHVDYGSDDDLLPPEDAFADWGGDEYEDAAASDGFATGASETGAVEDGPTTVDEAMPELATPGMTEELVPGADEATGAETEAEADADGKPTPAPTAASPRRPSGPHPAGVAVMAGLGTLVAAAGLGYGALSALGVAPERLLVFDGFTGGFAGIVDFQRHPVNLFWLVAGATVVLSLLVAASCGRAATAARRRAAAAEGLLDRLCTLRLEDEEPWQDLGLHADPTLDDFVTELLGAHRLLKAKLTRYIGQDGELHRLEKALVDSSRTDLTGTYENPAVASLADEIARLFDARVEAEQARIDLSERMRSGGANLNSELKQACQWNSAVLDQINLQGAALERVAVKVRKLGETAQRVAEAGGDERAALVAEVRKLVAGLPADGAAARGTQGLADLVDRGSKLAFQIAMEVARLGPRGERLLPMTQELEELTTEFRRLSSRLEGGDEAQEKLNTSLRNLANHVESLPEEGEDGSSVAAAGAFAESAREIGPLARQVGDKLLELARGFNRQTERLQGAGETSARITGVPFDYEAPQGTGTADEPDAIGVDRFDPFGKGEDQRPTTVPDPFASAPDPLMSGDGGGLEPLVTPGIESAPHGAPGAGSLTDAPSPADRMLGDGPAPDADTSPFSTSDLDPFAAEDAAADSAGDAGEPATAASPAGIPPTQESPAGGASGDEGRSDEETALDLISEMPDAPAADPAPASPPAADPAPASGETAPPRAEPSPHGGHRPASGAADLDLAPTADGDELPSGPDRVYDLHEFGAIPIAAPGRAARDAADPPAGRDQAADDAPGASTDDPDADEERIYDLNEFGAEVIG